MRMEEIESFLGIQIPQNIEIAEDSQVNFINNSAARDKIWEEDPQFYIDQAVIIESTLNLKFSFTALGTVIVNNKMCEGHFPFFHFMPLAILGQAVAQVGELLILSLNGGDTIPIVIEVCKIRSIPPKGEIKTKKFIVPGDKLLIKICYKGGKFNIHKVKAEIYVEGNLMTNIEEITYASVDKNYFK